MRGRRRVAPPLTALFRECLEVPGVLLNFALPSVPIENYGHHAHPVIVLPGLLAGDASTSVIRRSLSRAGFQVTGWGLGLNRGLRPGLLERLVARVQQVSVESGQKVILLGWSLGGIYAREVAKLAPDSVQLVVTLFSPFSGNPRANNAWRVYELISGQQINHLTAQFDLASKPPVQTIAVWSDRDGIVAPSCSCGLEGQSDQQVYVPSTHFGFGRNADAIRQVAMLMHDAK